MRNRYASNPASVYPPPLASLRCPSASASRRRRPPSIALHPPSRAAVIYLRRSPTTPRARFVSSPPSEPSPPSIALPPTSSATVAPPRRPRRSSTAGIAVPHSTAFHPFCRRPLRPFRAVSRILEPPGPTVPNRLDRLVWAHPSRRSEPFRNSWFPPAPSCWSESLRVRLVQASSHHRSISQRTSSQTTHQSYGQRSTFWLRVNISTTFNNWWSSPSVCFSNHPFQWQGYFKILFLSKFEHFIHLLYYLAKLPLCDL